MRKSILLPLLVLSVLGLSNVALADECSATHSKVGWASSLESRHHGTSGTVKVIDDCTIQIENFNYDGKGVDVRFVVADNSRFKKVTALTDDLHGKGAYEGVTLTVKLDEGQTLDDVSFVSFWCVAFKTSFADGALAAPSTMDGEMLETTPMNKRSMRKKAMGGKTMNVTK